MNATPSKLPPFYAAAMANIDPVWFKRFEKLGVHVVLLHILSGPESPVHGHPELEKALGLELQEIAAGYYDSSHYPGALNPEDSGFTWHFFHCTDLAKAMTRLKAQLEVRGLLNVCSIFHSEGPGEFRCWWSYDPTGISKLVSEEVSA